MEKQFKSKTIIKELFSFIIYWLIFNFQSKGYGDVEIETLFAKYDVDGDRCLNEAEQMAMLKDLAEQNDEIKHAYKIICHAQENKYFHIVYCINLFKIRLLNLKA